MQNDIENILNEIAAKDLNAQTDFFLSADWTADYADTKAVNLLLYNSLIFNITYLKVCALTFGKLSFIKIFCIFLPC